MRYFKIRSTAVILFLFGFTNLYGQEPITLSEALDTALKNNTYLKVAETQVKYAQLLARSAWEIPQTTAGFEYGRFNSLNLDNKFTISQSIQFPTVYKNQERILKTGIRVNELNFSQRLLDLEIEVKSVFYELLTLKDQRNLLVQADSMYAQFQQKVNQRFESGDIDILEKATADNQRIQISNQLKQLETDYELSLARFNVLLNGTKTYLPQADNSQYLLRVIPDSTSISENRFRLLQEQELILSKQEVRLEKSKLLPSLSAGFGSATITGWQTPDPEPEDLYFGSSKRFSSFNIGIGIPLFFGSQRSKIKAGNILVQQRELELTALDQELKLQLNNTIKTYYRNKLLLESFDRTLLPNSEMVIETVSSKLNAGEIGYIEWVILVNQTMQTRSDYYQTIQQCNEAAFRIEQITGIITH